MPKQRLHEGWRHGERAARGKVCRDGGGRDAELRGLRLQDSGRANGVNARLLIDGQKALLTIHHLPSGPE